MDIYSAPQFRRTCLLLTLGCSIILGGTGTSASAKSKAADPYYTGPSLFFPKPDSRSNWRVPNFGPVGIGITLEKPNFTMRIMNVEEGSPADKTGKLKKGQIIESVNGEVFKDFDPRIILANWITEAEATDGRIVLKIKGEGEVLVQIPVMGSYSPTWPENCPKSDKVVRNLADRLALLQEPEWGAVLFMLSTGEDKDLEVVKRWMKDYKTVGPYPWHKGYKGPGLCEYYLRTGDKSILPVIKQMADELKESWYNDAGWSGRGSASFTYGQLNAAGVHCLNFLLLAKLCGVEVDEYMLQQSLRHFYRYAGHGTLAYGNDTPKYGFRDNGKVAGLAVAMGSAARLTPNGEDSIYAKARDSSAMKSFYATNWFHAAHTGGGIGEIWRNITMCMMQDERPLQYRSFLDTRRWVMDLSRRWNGGIGIAGVADRYDEATGEGQIAWGNYFALTYTLHRKQLQMFGAPESPYAKQYQLPARPWGNINDDVFQYLYPAKHPSISMEDLLSETVQENSSQRTYQRWSDIDSDESYMYYLHHPEYAFRFDMARRMGAKDRGDIITEMLKAKVDPRLRLNGLIPLINLYKGQTLPDESLTSEMRDLVEKIYTDPNESWWVRINAIYALPRWGPDFVAKHKDQLLEELKHEDWWFQEAALITLSDIATDPKYYKEVLPAIAELFGTTRVGRIIHYARKFDQVIAKADKEVQAFAMPYFKQAFDEVPREFVDPTTGYVMKGGARYTRALLSRILLDLPGGSEAGRTDPKTTLKSAISGKEEDEYVFSGKYEPNKALIGKWLKQVDLMPAQLGSIEQLKKKRAAEIVKIKAKIEQLRATHEFKQEKRRERNPNARIKRFSHSLQDEIKPSYLTLNNDGSVGTSKVLFWTENWLVDNRRGEARRMALHNENGKTYLLVEKGGFTPDLSTRDTDSDDENMDASGGDDSDSELRPAGWHPGCEVYELVE